MARDAVDNMAEALAQRAHPSVTLWNRVEGRPRTANFERALRVEVRDALWMLTRQWQTSEFHGEDAGSPILVKLHMETTPLTRFRAGNAAAIDFDGSLPLEAQVEARPLVLSAGDAMVGLDIRLAMGRRWLKLIAGLSSVPAFKQRYAFAIPDPQQRTQVDICAHPHALQSVAAVAGERAMDGYELYRNLALNTFGVVNLPANETAALESAARTFVEWVTRTWLQPRGTDNPAWDPSRFEYRFACAAPGGEGEKTLVAEQYSSGSVDWFAFDLDPAAAALNATGAAGRLTRTTLPTPVTYAGMPHPRWWTMEDGRTNFGAIRPDTTDLAKLLFIEFGLVYSNDWFLIPITLPAGSLATVKGLVVTNVFGERLWIDPADQGGGTERSRFSLFTLTTTGGRPPEAALLMTPTVPKIQEGAPFEDVLLIRDEMANMVWAIEKTVPAPEGGGAAGADAGRETRAFHQRFVPAPTPPPAAANDARIRYELMTEMPEHWIPFVAASGSRLQRATMLRVLSPTDHDKIRPRTSLLRPGLGGGGFFVPQEEVPRAGARVTQTFQRTRWSDGRVVVWVGARKETGRGEGWSGLAFDRIVPKED